MARKSSKLSPQQRNRKHRKEHRAREKSLNAHLSEVSRRKWENQFGPLERSLSLRAVSRPPAFPRTAEQLRAEMQTQMQTKAKREALLNRWWLKGARWRKLFGLDEPEDPNARELLMFLFTFCLAALYAGVLYLLGYLPGLLRAVLGGWFGETARTLLHATLWGNIPFLLWAVLGLPLAVWTTLFFCFNLEEKSAKTVHSPFWLCLLAVGFMVVLPWGIASQDYPASAVCGCRTDLAVLKTGETELYTGALHSVSRFASGPGVDLDQSAFYQLECYSLHGESEYASTFYLLCPTGLARSAGLTPFTGWEHKNHPQKYRVTYLSNTRIVTDIRPLA